MLCSRRWIEKQWNEKLRASAERPPLSLILLCVLYRTKPAFVLFNSVGGRLAGLVWAWGKFSLWTVWWSVDRRKRRCRHWQKKKPYSEKRGIHPCCALQNYHDRSLLWSLVLESEFLQWLESLDGQVNAHFSFAKNASNASPYIPLIFIYLSIYRRAAPSAPSTPPQTLTPSRSPGKVSNIAKSKFTSRKKLRSFLFQKSSIASLAILILCENEVRALNDAGRRRKGGDKYVLYWSTFFEAPAQNSWKRRQEKKNPFPIKPF